VTVSFSVVTATWLCSWFAAHNCSTVVKLYSSIIVVNNNFNLENYHRLGDLFEDTKTKLNVKVCVSGYCKI
jgi:hypothetical protein